MQIKGQIDDVIYSNEVNSYTVCSLSCDDRVITAVRLFAFCFNG